MVRFAAYLILLAVFTFASEAAPIALKELQFLVRQKTPEATILKEVTERRLLAPLDAQSIQILKDAGATDDLITRLSAPNLALSTTQGNAEIQRKMAHEERVAQSAAEDAVAFEQREKMRAAIGQRMAEQGTVMRMLQGKLVRLSGDQFISVDAQEFAKVRIFAFYRGALWSGTCRKFLPKLIEGYRLLKQKYPDQFEVVYVSGDHDEFNLKETLRGEKVPFACVPYGSKDPEIEKFLGAPDQIPWLVLVADNGKVLTTNGVDKKYADPSQIMLALEQLLRQLQR